MNGTKIFEVFWKNRVPDARYVGEHGAGAGAPPPALFTKDEGDRDVYTLSQVGGAGLYRTTGVVSFFFHDMVSQKSFFVEDGDWHYIDHRSRRCIQTANGATGYTVRCAVFQDNFLIFGLKQEEASNGTIGIYHLGEDNLSEVKKLSADEMKTESAPSKILASENRLITWNGTCVAYYDFNWTRVQQEEYDRCNII